MAKGVAATLAVATTAATLVVAMAEEVAAMVEGAVAMAATAMTERVVLEVTEYFVDHNLCSRGRRHTTSTLNPARHRCTHCSTLRCSQTK